MQWLKGKDENLRKNEIEGLIEMILGYTNNQNERDKILNGFNFDLILQSPVLIKDLKLKLTSSAVAAASNLNF